MRRIRAWSLTPRAYFWVAVSALVVCTLIVFTGAAVRLTGSGLGCPDWPRCQGTRLTPELSTHAFIEFGNRLLTGVVGLPCLAAAILAWFRRPFRRDLALIALLLPLGVLCQAVLGGMTVWYGLKPGWVIGHFLLSMLLLVACVVARLARGARAGDDAARAGPGQRVGGARAGGARRDHARRRHDRHRRRSARGRRGHRRHRAAARLAGRRHARLGDPPARDPRDAARARRGRHLVPAPRAQGERRRRRTR